MSKKLKRFLEGLFLDRPADGHIHSFIQTVVGSEPFDAALLSKELDELIRLAKTAKNTLHPKRSEEEDVDHEPAR